MSSIPPISEASMQAVEDRFPELAAMAGRAAHERALTQTGRVVMKSANGMLVEARANGAIRVIKPLPATTPVARGLVLTRKKAGHGAR
ncbi:hypothetical protein OOT46_21640 [Aquabacterium sp. A7-Y]|uniref:hypothetical protein n=1 Tax=Aquabacterium sp. A7-Y TaxID=1349605 RepID=UPI00223D4183|nr:hypothetical protein [Aquabacterium sp. A7-Y]MCW7540435.1 hypothetical protein [Aquabacterium sp. A7-Y]